jgi:hypothetical protein
LRDVVGLMPAFDCLDRKPTSSTESAKTVVDPEGRLDLLQTACLSSMKRIGNLSANLRERMHSSFSTPQLPSSRIRARDFFLARDEYDLIASDRSLFGMA